MKVRNGFVSNSSSSSFCAYGISADREEVLQAWKKKKGVDASEDEDEDYDDMYDIANELIEDVDLYMEVGYDSEYFYFGRCYTSAADTWTFGDFKKSVQADVDTIFEGKECSHHEEVIEN